jgi:hypothetical protein
MHDVVEIYRREGGGEQAFPVEYKRGATKSHDADRVQLCCRSCSLLEVCRPALYHKRISRGQCVQQPCFGCREFPAFFEPVSTEARFDPPSELVGRRDLGWMLHDIDFTQNATPHFFRAELLDGVLTVPAVHFGLRGFGPPK